MTLWYLAACLAFITELLHQSPSVLLLLVPSKTSSYITCQSNTINKLQTRFSRRTAFRASFARFTKTKSFSPCARHSSNVQPTTTSFCIPVGNLSAHHNAIPPPLPILGIRSSSRELRDSKFPFPHQHKVFVTNCNINLLHFNIRRSQDPDHSYYCGPSKRQRTDTQGGQRIALVGAERSMLGVAHKWDES